MTEFDSREKIAQLVPHKGKMNLLDRVVFYDLSQAVAETEVDISEKTMFYDENFGGVPVWLAFEYMAQSIAALNGIANREKNSSQVGFILSVTNFKAEENVFLAKSVVRIWIKQIAQMDKAITFEGKASVGDKLFATATINTMPWTIRKKWEEYKWKKENAFL